MTYKYAVYTPHKKIVRGTLVVASESMAIEALERAGMKILSLKQVRSWSIEEQIPTLFRVKSQDIILFSRQVATLLEKGTRFLTALRLAREQTASRVFKKILTDVIKNVEEGGTFSDAITRHPQAFPLAYSMMIRVGEQTGELKVVLRDAAAHIEQDETTRKRIISQLTYPALVVVMGIASTVVLVTAVLPPLMRVFTEFNTALPWPTKLLLALVSFVSVYKFYLMGVVFLLIALLLLALTRSSGRYQVERLTMQLPLIGRIVLLRNLAYFTRITSLLFGAGFPIIEVITTAQKCTQNEVVRRALDNIPKSVLQGQTLSQAMKTSKLFPSMLIQMVITGEDTNTLDSSFAALADHYESEFNRALTGFISMLEPLLMIAIGLAVGFIAIATITPMYSIYNIIE